MGVLEAPLVKLPVVNVGLRQKDRQNAGNILFVTCNKNKIIFLSTPQNYSDLKILLKEVVN